MATWLAGIVRLLDGQLDLVRQMHGGTVKATIWIATLIHDTPPPPLQLDPALVRAATRCGAEILVEDYNGRDEEGLVPAKTWFR